MKSTVLCDIRIQRFPHDYQVKKPSLEKFLEIYILGLWAKDGILVFENSRTDFELGKWGGPTVWPEQHPADPGVPTGGNIILHHHHSLQHERKTVRQVLCVDTKDNVI